MVAQESLISNRRPSPNRTVGIRPSRKAAALGIVGAMLLLTGVNVQAAANPTWTLVTSPPTGISSSLNGVSCSNPHLCMAVGDYAASSSADRTLSETWNGTAVAVIPSPPPTGFPDIELNEVSCPSASFCMAVGSLETSGGDQIVSEKWNGSTWTLLTSPNLGPNASVDLYGVSCKSSTWCMAVGWSMFLPSELAFAMQWNGSSWVIDTVPDISGEDNILESVSCATTSFCIAVGNTEAGQLIDRWNGSAWSIVSSAANRALYGVRCRSPKFCMAAGFQLSGSIDKTLAEKWNGATWTVMSTPNISGTTENMLLSVSCTGTTFCMAVGDDADSGVVRTLTEAWNGTTWSVKPSVNPSSDDVLNSVSCTNAAGSEFCLAVGDGSGQNLVEKYAD